MTRTPWRGVLSALIPAGRTGMLWNAAVILVALQMTWAASSADPARPPVAPIQNPLHVQLVASDRFGFRDEFLASMGRDVLAILRTVDIDATWSTEEQIEAAAERPWREVDAADSFLVVFTGKPPSAWGMKRRAMGTVVPATHHPRRRIIVFPGRVLQVLDADRPPGRPPADTYHLETARAFARVVVHELVHALAPEHSHAEQGLMRGTLNRRFLLGHELPIDAACRVAISSALRLLRIDAGGS